MDYNSEDGSWDFVFPKNIRPSEFLKTGRMNWEEYCEQEDLMYEAIRKKYAKEEILENNTVNKRLEQALKYAEAGFRIIPVSAGKKVTYEKGWPQTSTTDADKIKQIFENDPNSNYGILPSTNLMIIDVDQKNGSDGWANIQSFEKRTGIKICNWDKCPCQSTPTGGLHYFVQFPHGQMLKKKKPGTKKDGKEASDPVISGVDFLVGDNYAVGAYSYREDLQKHYELVRDIGEFDPACISQEFSDYICSFESPDLTPDIEQIPAPPLPTPKPGSDPQGDPNIYLTTKRFLQSGANWGGHNISLYTSACNFRLSGYSQSDAEAHLLPVGQRYESQPQVSAQPNKNSNLSADRATIRSAYSAAQMGTLYTLSSRREFMEKKNEPINNTWAPVSVDQKLITLKPEWFPPLVNEISDYFFWDYEENVYQQTLKNKKHCSMRYAALVSIKYLIGKRMFLRSNFCGSDMLFLLGDSSAGKSKILEFCYKYLICENRYDPKYEISSNNTFQSVIKTARKAICPDTKIPGKFGKFQTSIPNYFTISQACKNNDNTFLLYDDEAAKSFSKLVGLWGSNPASDLDSVIKSLSDPVGRLVSASILNGDEFLEDWAFIYMFATTYGAMKAKCDFSSPDFKNSGLSTRVLAVCEDNRCFSPAQETPPPTPERFEEILQKLKMANQIQKQECYLSKEIRQAGRCLDFGKDQPIFEEFKRSQPELYRSGQEKLERSAMGDAMAWAWCNDTIEISHPLNSSKKVIDIGPYYINCLKARFATLVNRHYLIGAIMVDLFDEEVVLKVRSNPGTTRTELYASVSSNRKDWKLIKESVDRLIDKSRIKENKRPQKGPGAPSWELFPLD